MKTILLAVLVSGTVALAGQPVPYAKASREIDALVLEGLAKQKLKPNAPAPDEVFLRRVYLDVTGRIPTVAEARAFLASKDQDKRAKLIDQLLSSAGYVHHFTNYWADVLRAQSQGIGDSTSAQAFVNYIRESLRSNKPYDQFVREMVAAEATVFQTGAVGYYMRDRGMPLDNLSNTTRIFLGTRMECAQCHNHPFDRWTQMDFYKMAAFSHTMTASNFRAKSHEETQKMIREAKDIEPETRDMMRRALTEVFRPLQSTEVVQNKGALRLPHDYKYSDAKPKDVVQAAAMFGRPVPLTKESNPIQEYAKWMTGPENPRFTNVIANRMWKKAFGLALIEPLDELTDSSVASNPALMKHLEKMMVAMKYDLKAFLRVILNTEAYQRESTREDLQPGTPYYFQGPVFRRMSAEQIWDSFVTLVNPSPDAPNWTLRERERRELENRRQLSSLLTGTEAELLFDASKQVAMAMKEQNKGFDKLRKDLETARAKDDKEAVREIQRKLNDSQRILRETISKCFYEAARKSKNPATLAKLKEFSSGGPMEMAMMNMMADVRVDYREMALPDTELASYRKDAARVGAKDPKSLKSYETYRRGLHQTWSRASELQSPAPRGHFLREFGQSDRDVIENANDDASVPQALTILNGSLVTQLANGWSALSMELKDAPDAAAKLDALFLALYARHPSQKEKAFLLSTLDSAAGSKTIWEDIVSAAVGTQRFLFIE